MENVNNLNGVPNFGHGFPQEEDEGSIDEVESTTDTEDNGKKRTSKSKKGNE